MNKTLKNSLLGTAVLMLFFITAAHPGMAEGVPPLPMTVQGVALIDGSPAPNDTVIAAYLDGEYVEKYLINTPEGSFNLLIPGETEDEGKPVTFTINEEDTGKSFAWGPGKVVSSVKLSIGDAGDSGSSKSSTSNSGSGSLTESEDAKEDGEVIENGAVTQPEVAVPEKTVPESTGDKAEVKETEGSSKTASTSGFQIIYAVAGVVLLTFGLEFWRESKRKP
ncbi:hypothetical protein RSJ42_03350 [Methanosarcina hadiensis]|uniref:hypothetical protein n=1 Tax=Methanosarcina hadiensis TaxID=3078083 RepID=UPI0039775457